MMPNGDTPRTSLDIPPKAITLIKIEPKQTGCGRWAFGNNDILVNTHTQLRIRIWVLTKWVYRNRERQEENIYDLHAGQRLDLGCDVWRPDLEPLQEFDRTPVRAIYL